HPDRYFDANPTRREIARRLYQRVAGLPLVCPHGHVDPRLLAENPRFPDPASLIVIPDHYIFRMLYSQGVPLEKLGIPRVDGGPVERDPRAIWQLFADHFHLFRGTPTGCWLKHEFAEVFGIEETLNHHNAMAIYERIESSLEKPEFRPRALFERFRIEVLCTTDAATDTLAHHAQIRASGWPGIVLPTFRPDACVQILSPAWTHELARLAELTGKDTHTYSGYIAALEQRRAFFREMGARATDHGVYSIYTAELSSAERSDIFNRALAGEVTEDDAIRFSGHMLMEFARMSVEDGLVMQVHPGSLRNHNDQIFQAYGADKGCDIPVATEYTRNLQPLLNKFGNHKDFRLVIFTLDESTYSRELAPLAGHYPALRLGPAWWFFDSIEGMTRYRYATTETAGIYNTAGFNDDTRAFPSIPARHDLSRRVDANFLADLVSRHIVDEDEAEEMIEAMAYRLVRETYRMEDISLPRFAQQ
ncbi:MAG: glucuronate isomerase, partial [Bryobacterales bacterium]|nr:glucuronate isomerase [Bryobacterales bacterium]